MNTRTDTAWTTEQLLNFSHALGSGYAPGVNRTKATGGDRWTAQRHIQASAARAQAYL
jgi:hypothetical protein